MSSCDKVYISDFDSVDMQLALDCHSDLIMLSPRCKLKKDEKLCNLLFHFLCGNKANRVEIKNAIEHFASKYDDLRGLEDLKSTLCAMECIPEEPKPKSKKKPKGKKPKPEHKKPPQEVESKEEEKKDEVQPGAEQKDNSS